MANFDSDFTGLQIDDLLTLLSSYKDNIHLEDGTDLNDLVNTGFYYSWSGANTEALLNVPNPTNLGGMLLIVFRTGYEKNTSHQIIINNSADAIFHRRWMSGTWGSWRRIELFETPRSGNTATRVNPVGYARSVIGDMFFDTSIGKPVFWTGDTTKGDNGWVDANGENPYTQQ